MPPLVSEATTVDQNDSESAGERTQIRPMDSPPSSRQPSSKQPDSRQPSSRYPSSSHTKPWSPGPEPISPLEWLLHAPAFARSPSSFDATAWEAQHETPSPALSQGSRRGFGRSQSTGNLLVLNPSINEQYLAQQNFQPANPGQLELRAGEAVRIAQVFDNGWVRN